MRIIYTVESPGNRDPICICYTRDIALKFIKSLDQFGAKGYTLSIKTLIETPLDIKIWVSQLENLTPRKD